MRADPDAGPALRLAADRPPGRWPGRHHQGRRHRFSIRCVRRSRAGGGGLPGARGIRPTGRAGADDARGDGARLQLGALGRRLSRRLPARRGPGPARLIGLAMDFLLMLHSHLPWVLNHGRWPHGSDWLCEAAVDTYLPLLEAFQALDHERVTAPVTIGVTPVLANMLASPVFVEELEAFFEQRLEACDQADAELPELDPEVAPLVGFWRDRYTRLRELFRASDSDLIGAFRALEARGRIEIIGSAATHGFLPLLARDESIRLQLAVGVAEHRRLFGRAPNGCWLPECAYRPRGPWAPWPTAPRSGVRRGIEEHLGDAGFGFFFIDAHLAAAGRPLGVYGDPLVGPREAPDTIEPERLRTLRTPYRAYRVAPARGTRPVAAFVRDPRASMQVWSRHHGYPGDGQYLEFHKIRWPGGLKLWQVTGENVDLG